MVGWVLFAVCVAVNIVMYWLIDAYFLYIEALHTHTYKSNHYIQQKKIAQKKNFKTGVYGYVKNLCSTDAKYSKLQPPPLYNRYPQVIIE